MTTAGLDQPDEIRITVAHPERFWFAVRSEMPWLVDPDVEDGRRRHISGELIRWAAVGEIVQELGGGLARQEFQKIIDEDGIRFEVVTADRFAMTKAEKQIVASWFTDGEAPCSDPWENSLVNGRHRLWGVWGAMPEVALPVLSDHLLYEGSVDHMGEEFGQLLYLSSKIGLLKVPLDAPVRARSTAYFDRLEVRASQAPATFEADQQIELEMMVVGFSDGYSKDLEIEQPDADGDDGSLQGVVAFFKKLIGRQRPL